jgi:hypothetical protein
MCLAVASRVDGQAATHSGFWVSDNPSAFNRFRFGVNQPHRAYWWPRLSGCPYSLKAYSRVLSDYMGLFAEPVPFGHSDHGVLGSAEKSAYPLA